MQQVDPFVPVSSPPKARPVPGRPAAPNQVPSRPATTSNVTFQAPPTAQHAPHQTAKSQFATSPPHHHATTHAHPQKTHSRSRRVGRKVAQVVGLMGVLCLGFLIRSLVVGQIAILIYAVVCVIYKIESRTTFVLALMSMGVVLLASMIADGRLASVFAVYAFLLLVIGAITMAFEVRDEV